MMKRVWKACKAMGGPLEVGGRALAKKLAAPAPLQLPTVLQEPVTPMTPKENKE